MEERRFWKSDKSKCCINSNQVSEGLINFFLFLHTISFINSNQVSKGLRWVFWRGREGRRGLIKYYIYFVYDIM